MNNVLIFVRKSHPQNLPKMKYEVFDAYVKKVLERFVIERADFFSKSKRQDLVDARYLLYFLCYNRPMRIRYIQEYMLLNGYDVSHTTILHGIKEMKKRIKHDDDYVHVVKEIEKCIVL